MQLCILLYLAESRSMTTALMHSIPLLLKSWFLWQTLSFDPEYSDSGHISFAVIFPAILFLWNNANATSGPPGCIALLKSGNSSNEGNSEEQSDCNCLLSKGLVEKQVENHKSGQLPLCFKPYLSQIPQIPSSALKHFAYQSVLH